jgi:hypothetical protein
MKVRNGYITGRCELLLRLCYYFCLQTSQAVCPLSNSILASQERWPRRKSFRKFCFRRVAAGTLNDAPCFLINASHLVFENKKNTCLSSHFIIIVVTVT